MNTMTITMPTTASAITCNSPKTYILSKEDFLIAQAAWKATTHHSSAEIIAYNILRGLEPTRGFTPLTERKAASRSNDPWDGYNTPRELINWTMKKAMPISIEDTAITRANKLNEANKERFKKWFNLELTDELMAAFPILEKKKNA